MFGVTPHRRIAEVKPSPITLGTRADDILQQHRYYSLYRLPASWPTRCPSPALTMFSWNRVGSWKPVRTPMPERQCIIHARFRAKVANTVQSNDTPFSGCVLRQVEWLGRSIFAFWFALTQIVMMFIHASRFCRYPNEGGHCKLAACGVADLPSDPHRSRS